jgi:hypothetical protein
MQQPDHQQARDLRSDQTVLALLHGTATDDHVLDAAGVLAGDPRVRVFYTQRLSRPASRASATPHIIPWARAVCTDFDLVVAADPTDVHRLRGPWLALGADPRPWATWHGHPQPAALVAPNRDIVSALAGRCQQVPPVAAVIGDLCLDRLTRSRPHRATYRRALGVPDGPTLVGVITGCGPNSLLACAPALLFDVLAALPAAEFAVALVVEPTTCYKQDTQWIRAWIDRQRRAGLCVVDPVNWRGLVCASDVLVGDHGTATTYAAATGVPVLRAVRLPPETAPGSPAAMLAAAAPVVRPDQPLTAHLRQAVDAFNAARYATVATAISSRPGQAARLLRERIYRLLGLPEPPADCAALPVGYAISQGRPADPVEQPVGAHDIRLQAPGLGQKGRRCTVGRVRAHDAGTAGG